MRVQNAEDSGNRERNGMSRERMPDECQVMAAGREKTGESGYELTLDLSLQTLPFYALRTFSPTLTAIPLPEPADLMQLE